jgi:hypothetical protein
MKDIQKIVKKLPPEFVDAINGMKDEEIKQRILTCEQNLYDVEDAKEADEKLQAIKEEAKAYAAPYRETKNLETAKIKYCLFMLESRGVAINKE